MKVMLLPFKEDFCVSKFESDKIKINMKINAIPEYL